MKYAAVLFLVVFTAIFPVSGARAMDPEVPPEVMTPQQRRQFDEAQRKWIEEMDVRETLRRQGLPPLTEQQSIEGYCDEVLNMLRSRVPGLADPGNNTFLKCGLVLEFFCAGPENDRCRALSSKVREQFPAVAR